MHFLQRDLDQFMWEWNTYRIRRARGSNTVTVGDVSNVLYFTPTSSGEHVACRFNIQYYSISYICTYVCMALYSLLNVVAQSLKGPYLRYSYCRLAWGAWTAIIIHTLEPQLSIGQALLFQRPFG